MIYKDKGIMYAEYVVDKLNYYLTDIKDIIIKAETFYNCREMGYVLNVHKEDNWGKIFHIWVYAHRNSDEPTMVYGEDIKADNMFTDTEWANNQDSFDNLEDLVDKAYKLIKEKMEV